MSDKLDEAMTHADCECPYSAVLRNEVTRLRGEVEALNASRENANKIADAWAIKTGELYRRVDQAQSDAVRIRRAAANLRHAFVAYMGAVDAGDWSDGEARDHIAAFDHMVDAVFPSTDARS